MLWGLSSLRKEDGLNLIYKYILSVLLSAAMLIINYFVTKPINAKLGDKI